MWGTAARSSNETSNQRGVKGHSQTIDGIMIEPDWEAVVHTWLTL